MRNTKARLRIIDIFKKALKPLVASEVLEQVNVNKTTIYRELDFLVKKGILEEVDFGDRKKRYELKQKEDLHHHHLVCLSCQKISDIMIEERFEIPKDFQLIRHNLEFFGLCSNCK